MRPGLYQVIIFYSMLPNGQMDDFSLHGGCDVLDPDATKWSANFWLVRPAIVSLVAPSALCPRSVLCAPLLPACVVALRHHAPPLPLLSRLGRSVEPSSVRDSRCAIARSRAPLPALPPRWNKPYHFMDPARKKSTSVLQRQWL